MKWCRVGSISLSYQSLDALTEVISPSRAQSLRLEGKGSLALVTMAYPAHRCASYINTDFFDIGGRCRLFRSMGEIMQVKQGYAGRDISQGG